MNIKMKKYIIKRTTLSYLFMVCLIMPMLFIACSDDDDTTLKGEPIVKFEEESKTFYVKVNKSINIKPIIENTERPIYSWKLEGKIIGTEEELTFEAKKEGDYFVTFRLDAENGSVEDEIKISVLELTPPILSLPIPEEGYLTAEAGKDLELAPKVNFYEGASYEWYLDDKVMGTDSVYIFKETKLGDYPYTLVATNEDGKSSLKVIVRVVKAFELSITFEKEEFTVPLGRPITLVPIIDYASDATTYQWKVDGIDQDGETNASFTFTPGEKKEYKITIVGKDKDVVVEKEVKVTCIDAIGTYYRQATASSKANANKVYEFLAAPGQFVNEYYQANTMQEACDYAINRLNSTQYVSLGGFGGYLVVGFDHSIDNKEGGTDFSVIGNAFRGSSEPGIVWVMQDDNGNGLPDDTWYELKGSEYGKPETIQDYAVTYYKPTQSGMDVQWVDNKGGSGYIDYLKAYHTQPYYYPNWVKERSYTLRGTCLKARNTESGGIWYNGEFDWGYADNFGNDREPGENANADPNATYFEIDNAVFANGKPANLKYIDFVKVQTGINTKSGWLGEVSTEVFGVKDINLNK